MLISDKKDRYRRGFDVVVDVDVEEEAGAEAPETAPDEAVDIEEFGLIGV